ncbi:MAG TPA: hypothetical protein VHO04_03485 [Sphingopyxis sp.]|uniref:hypothetical protein n=1 Tax=Sphingopyxis sp. TaxID=1908224 RepID=UPI002E358CBD|nr:hypothetical protein [Sphingopyxis sp.]HEX2811723.1 hypothetical protein [Sphingopyxis sp.]
MMIKKPFTILPLALALLGPISSSPGLAAPTPAAVPDTIAGTVRQTAPAIYRFTIGDAQITALSDGSVPLDLHQLLRGVSAQTIDEILARSFLGVVDKGYPEFD